MDVSGRLVLVTGGTGTLGRVVVQRLLDEDARVVTTYLDDAEWDALREQADAEQLTGYKADVTAADQVRQVVERVVEEHGEIDVLLHLVGAWTGSEEMHAVDEGTWDRMLDVNLKSAFLATRAVLPGMREQGAGRIICIGSRLGHELPAEGGPYAVAKHGLEALTAIVARENQDAGVTMNCVLPSVIGEGDGEVSPDAITDLIIDTISSDKTGDALPIYEGS